MASEVMQVYKSLENMDHSPSKSTVRRWLDKVTGGGLTVSGAQGLTHHGIQLVRQAGESGVVGMALGAASVELRSGLDMGKVPIDGALAVGAGVASVLMGSGYLGDASRDLATDARNVSSASLAIFSFRKSREFLARKKGITVNGEFGDDSYVGAEDPIVAAARRL